MKNTRVCISGVAKVCGALSKVGGLGFSVGGPLVVHPKGSHRRLCHWFVLKDEI